ncbi:TraB/GumN family protein, partial [Enterococcus faecalis]
MQEEFNNKNVKKIVFPEKTYYLVGTSHISENSVELVKEVIERVQPDTVSIELDKKRGCVAKFQKINRLAHFLLMAYAVFNK